MALATGAHIGAYEIVSLIGAGGMGEVYRANDTVLKRQVALKVVAPEFAAAADQQRFQREAEILAALNHPNIAQIYGVDRSGGALALIMELVEGPTLAQRIALGPIPLDEALRIAKQIAEALEAAHELGIIHRDLKPANIKIRPDGAVKVLDFGLAKATAPDAAGRSNLTNSPTLTVRATSAGVILGTAAYMSPEQAAARDVDKRTDLWAFGVVLFEMLSGAQVFSGETVSHVLASVLKDEPDWTSLPANTVEPIRRLLRRCLNKDARHRLADAADARLEIEDVLDGRTRDAVPAVAQPLALRRLLPFLIALVLGTAIVAVLATRRLMRVASATRPPLMRFNVDLGPDAVAAGRTTILLSPDGGRILFPVRGADGIRKLATRAIDQAAHAVLPGTDNATDAFFSPDGQWVGFAAGGKIKKVPVQGGPVVNLADCRILRGAAWLDDGNIVAAIDATAGLSRIPASGGAPQPLTRLANGEATHRWPQPLPDGHHVLFTASKTTGYYEQAMLQVVDVNTGQTTTVAQGGFFGRYTSGYLTYVHEGVLWGVPFDLSQLKVNGTPQPLVEDVSSDQNFGSAQFDVSRTGMAVYRSGRTSSEWPVVWMDDSGKTAPLVATPAPYFTPRISPNGRLLALSQDTANGRDVYVYDIARSTTSRLTFDGHGNRNPVWTPDGRHVVYASGDGKAISWIRADGSGEPLRLMQSSNTLVPWSFSPDGRRLSYTEITPDTQADLWILPVDARDPDRPAPGNPEVFLKTPANEGIGVAFSSDGRWIAYISDESGRGEVYVRPSQRAESGKWQLSTSGGQYPLWSGNGRTLFYVAQDERIMAVEFSTQGGIFIPGAPRLWSQTPVRPMTRSITPGMQPLDLAPDGRRFAVLPRDEPADEKGSVHGTFLINMFVERHR